MQKLWRGIKNHKAEITILLLILAAAIFLRFYNLGEFLHFANDEAEHAFVLQNLWTNGAFPLEGPPVSIASYHLGPFFYYLTAIPFALSGASPLGAAVIVPALGALTVFLLWYVMRRWFGAPAALIAAALYATSLLVVRYDRFAWAPDIMPLFSLLYVWFGYLTIKTGISLKKTASCWANWYIVFWALAAGVLVQLHSTGFLYIILALILLIIYRPKIRSKYFYIALAGFVSLQLPLLVYDLGHGLANSRALWRYFFGPTESGEPSLFQSVANTFRAFFDFYGEAFASNLAGWLLNVILIIISWAYLVGRVIWSLWRLWGRYLDGGGSLVSKIPGRDLARQILFIWGVFVFGAFAFFHREFFAHYFASIFCLPFILLAMPLGWLWARPWYGRALSLLLALALITLNVTAAAGYFRDAKAGAQNYEFSETAVLGDMSRAVEFVIADAGGTDFGVEIKPDNRFGRAYAYLFNLAGQEPKNQGEYLYKIEQPYPEDLSCACSDKDLVKREKFGNILVEKRIYKP